MESQIGPTRSARGCRANRAHAAGREQPVSHEATRTSLVDRRCSAVVSSEWRVGSRPLIRNALETMCVTLGDEDADLDFLLLRIDANRVRGWLLLSGALTA